MEQSTKILKLALWAWIVDFFANQFDRMRFGLAVQSFWKKKKKKPRIGVMDFAGFWYAYGFAVQGFWMKKPGLGMDCLRLTLKYGVNEDE